MVYTWERSGSQDLVGERRRKKDTASGQGILREVMPDSSLFPLLISGIKEKNGILDWKLSLKSLSFSICLGKGRKRQPLPALAPIQGGEGGNVEEMMLDNRKQRPLPLMSGCLSAEGPCARVISDNQTVIHLCSAS